MEKPVLTHINTGQTGKIEIDITFNNSDPKTTVTTQTVTVGADTQQLKDGKQTYTFNNLGIGEHKIDLLVKYTLNDSTLGTIDLDKKVTIKDETPDSGSTTIDIGVITTIPNTRADNGSASVDITITSPLGTSIISGSGKVSLDHGAIEQPLIEGSNDITFDNLSDGNYTLTTTVDYTTSKGKSGSASKTKTFTIDDKKPAKPTISDVSVQNTNTNLGDSTGTSEFTVTTNRGALGKTAKVTLKDSPLTDSKKIIDNGDGTYGIKLTINTLAADTYD
jgi:hypothetical protein